MKWAPIDKAIRTLNEALALDPDTIQRIFFTEAVCNGALAHHPTIQVTKTHKNDGKETGYGYISALVEGDGKIVHFERTNIAKVRKRQRQQK